MKSKAFVQTGLEEEYLRGMGMPDHKAMPSVARTPLVGAGGGWRADSRDVASDLMTVLMA
eukprot:scaffold6381_cov152-Isochrysis_galbana.AAC.6